LLGDEGSAFNIGLKAIAAAARAADLRAEPTVLQEIVEEHFANPTMKQITRIVYRAGFSRDQISLLSPKVAQAARDGDIPARSIMEYAGTELALTALGVMRQLFVPGTTVGVYLTGGVFTAGSVVLDPFRVRLHQGWPTAEASQPRFPPAVGGLILAARSLDVTIDSAWLTAVASSLPVVQR
jgi:N-acetylglucosamine kinase-like BadF-type ATPase